MTDLHWGICGVVGIFVIALVIEWLFGGGPPNDW